MVKAFKDGSKTIYAVTDIDSIDEAVNEVIRSRKESLKTAEKYSVDVGRIIERDNSVELWKDKDTEVCWIITKE